MEGGFEVFDFSQASAVAVRSRRDFVFLEGFSVSRRDDSDVLDHEDHCPLRSARTMQDTLGDNRSLSRTEFYRSAFEINQQLPLEHVEKFVIVIMLVPVVLA